MFNYFTLSSLFFLVVQCYDSNHRIFLYSKTCQGKIYFECYIQKTIEKSLVILQIFSFLKCAKSFSTTITKSYNIEKWTVLLQNLFQVGNSRKQESLRINKASQLTIDTIQIIFAKKEKKKWKEMTIIIIKMTLQFFL